MNLYERYLKTVCNNKKNFILTAENKLALRNLPNNKVLDVGICEQNLIGIASGITKKGGRCFVHALSNFLVSRAYEFIKINLDYQKNSCVLVGAMGGFSSTFNGPTHQSVDEISVIGNLKNFDVFFPATEYEMVLFLKKYKFKKSLYIRYNPINNEVLNKFIKIKYIPNQKLLGDGKNTIFSYGVCAEQIFKILNKNNFLRKKFKLYNFSLPTNINKASLLKILNESKNLLIIEDHMNKGSLSEKIKIFLYENNIRIKVISKNLGNNYFHPRKSLNELFNNYDINEQYFINFRE